MIPSPTVKLEKPSRPETGIFLLRLFFMSRSEFTLPVAILRFMAGGAPSERGCFCSS